MAQINGIKMLAVDADAASAAASAGFKTAVAGGAALSWGGWTSNDIAMIGGLVLGVIGLLVQWYYRRAEFKLRLSEHRARMSALVADK